jgi:hypothetical protein
MIRKIHILFVSLLLVFGAQSFAMSRVFHSMRTKVAVRATAFQNSIKRAFTNAAQTNAKIRVKAFQGSNNSTFSRFGFTQKQTPSFSRARIALASSLGLTAAGLALYAKSAKAEPEKPKGASKIVPWQALKDQKMKEFEVEEREILKRILAFCGISEEEWKKRLNIFFHNYSANPEYRSQIDAHLEKLLHKIDGSLIHETRFEERAMRPEVKEYIKKSLDEHGINSASVDIFIYNRPDCLKYAFVKAWLNKDFQPQYCIGITADWHDTFNNDTAMRKQFEGVIQHEIQHMLNNDPLKKLSSAVLMLNALEKKEARGTFEEGIEIYNILNHFCEKRADILACLQGPEFALKLAYFFKNEKIEEVSFTHPASLTRSEYCMDLYNQMKAYQDKSN